MQDRSRDDQIRLLAQNLGATPVLGRAEWAILDEAADTLSSGRADLKVSAGVGYLEITAQPRKQNQAFLAWSWMSDQGLPLDSGIVALDRPAAMNWSTVEVQCTPEVGGVWLSSDAVACGVQLTSTTQGRFENNGFIMLPGQRYWIGFQSSDGDEVVPQQVKVAHLGMYADAR